MQHRWILLGAIMAGLAVTFGAFGAHGLDGFLLEKHDGDSDLSIKRIADWKTAALYQMHHAIGIILVGIMLNIRNNRWLNIAGCCFTVGIALFSGLLYVLVLTEIRPLGAVVPIGGISLIIGWIAFGIGALGISKTNPSSN